MVVLSSVSGHVHTPTNVCVGNAGEKWIRQPDITEENELDVRKATMNPSTVATEQDDYKKDILHNSKLMSQCWVSNQ